MKVKNLEESHHTDVGTPGTVRNSSTVYSKETAAATQDAQPRSKRGVAKIDPKRRGNHPASYQLPK